MDSEVPEYQLSIKKTWEQYVLSSTFKPLLTVSSYAWPTNYPDYREVSLWCLYQKHELP